MMNPEQFNEAIEKDIEQFFKLYEEEVRFKLPQRVAFKDVLVKYITAADEVKSKRFRQLHEDNDRLKDMIKNYKETTKKYYAATKEYYEMQLLIYNEPDK